MGDGPAIAITADHTDAAANPANQATASILKDTSNPTVAITSSPLINNANKAAYNVSGTCSENTRTVLVNVGGVAATPTCSALAWSTTMNVTAVSDSASVSITANHNDAAGNTATQASTTVIKDTNNPTVAISSSPVINNANKAAYTVSGTCSENTRTVSVSIGGVAVTPTCTTLAWSTTVDVTAVLDNAAVSITANHTDAAGNNATQASTTVLKDTSNPTVAITSSPVINNANKAAYTVSGTCSENTRTVTVNVGGVAASPTCSALAWSTTVNATSVGDNAAISITANHTDAAGNTATQASTTVLKDTSNPTVAITSSPIINNANKTAYPISGTCSENTRTVSISVGGISATPTCTALAWSATLNVSGLADSGSVSITANHSDAAGNNATQASTTVVKNTGYPSVAITSAPSINNSNKASYPVGGTCSENGRIVTVSVGGIGATPTCTTLTWSTSVNATGLSDSGSVTITADHDDSAANPATQASTTVIKDTVDPTVAITSSPVINNANKAAYVVSGTCSENTRTVTVNVGGVSGTPTCTASAWSTTLNVTGVSDGGSVSVTANHTDAAGNTATQASTTVLKDTSNPTVAITSSPVINNANKAAYTVSGTCSENTRTVTVNVGGVSGTPTCSASAWSTTLNVTGVSDGGSVSITANHTDAAGNNATQASTTVVKDTTPPTVAITSSPIINNANKAAYPVSGTCSENTRTVTVNVGGVSASPTCTASAWSTSLNVTGVSDSGSVAITADHTDTAGNSATQATTSVLKDTSNPTVAITSAPTINDSNQAAYPVSGTCSENTRTVTVNVGGVSATPTCTALAWSASLNVTGVADSGSVSITANHIDAAGNNATQASTTVIKDATPPTVAITSSPVINNANKAAYPVSGTCSENTRTVTVNVGGVSATPTCSALAWSTSLNVTGVADSGSVAITANHSDVNGNNATQASTTVIKDTTPPTVAITSSPVINNANKTSYVVSGTCSENTRTVLVSIGGVLTSPTCTALSWTTAATNVTAAPDSATLSITANHADAAGNSATQASTTVVKDTSNPTVAITSSPVINNANKTSYTVTGTCSESGRTVTINVGSVSTSDTCTILTWSATVDVSGNQDSATLLITADHTDANGNNAVQAGTTVVKDTVAPTVAISSAPLINNANKTAYTVSGTCSENGRAVAVNIGGVAANPNCSAGSWSTGAINVSTAADSGTLLITANHTDSAGNSATQATTNVIKDTVNPLVAITSSPTINIANRTAYTVSGTCSENTRTVTVSIGGIAASPTCSGGAWSTGAINVTSASDSATFSITANHTDSNGNSASQASASIIKDTIAPSIILSSTEPSPTSNPSWVVRATFSEPVTGVAIGDFVIGNGTPSGFNVVSTAIYDITVTPTTDGAVTVNMPAAAANDAGGNASTIATQYSRTYASPAVLAYDVTSTHNFGSTNIGGIAEVIVVINKSGSANASSVTETNLSAPFSFKGGSFPGVGGTCGTTISSTCSLVLLYTPTAAATHNGSVRLQYNNGASTQSITRNLTGTGVSNPPTNLSIAGPAGIMINQCIPYTINTVTSSGANSAVTSNQTITLVVNNGTGIFYSNSGCTTTITNTIVSNGTSSKLIYFKSTTAAQTLTLVFNSASLNNTTFDVKTTNTPTKISFTTPLEMQTNSCIPFVVNLVDANGTKVGKAGTVQVNLAQNGSAGFFSDVSCTGSISSISYSAFQETNTIYVKNASQQSVNFNFTDNASILTADSSTVAFVNALTWWNASYSKRMPITLSNLDQNVVISNIPVLVKINSSRINYSDFLSGGADVRFTLDDHTTTLSYEIESWNTLGDSYIWVKVPSIAATSEKVIYLYYDYTSASDGQNAASVWSSFAGVWNMKKTGANYIDSTGSGKTGVPEGTVADVSGPTANAIYVNGSSAINVGYDLSQIIGQNSTFSFWVKTTQAGNNTFYLAPGITGIRDDSAGFNEVYYGWLDATGRLGINARNGAGIKSNFTVNDNSWRHVTMSRNASTGAVRFYVNGVLNGSGSSGKGTVTRAFSRFGVRSSFNPSGASSYFVGSMDGLRLKSTIETDDNIKAEYKFSVETNITFGASENY